MSREKALGSLAKKLSDSVKRMRERYQKELGRRLELKEENKELKHLIYTQKCELDDRREMDRRVNISRGRMRKSLATFRSRLVDLIGQKDLQLKNRMIDEHSDSMRE